MSASPAVSLRIDYDRIARNAAEIAARVRVPVLAVVKADAYGLGAGRIAEALADVVGGFCVFSLREAVEAELWRRTGKETIVLGPAGMNAKGKRQNAEVGAGGNAECRMQNAEVGTDVGDYLAHHVRPGVCSIEQAAALRAARPLVCVDTGMQRWGCPPDELAAVARAGGCEEVFTHAVRLEQALLLAKAAGRSSAAGAPTGGNPQWQRRPAADPEAGRLCHTPARGGTGGTGPGLRLHAAASNLLDEPAAWLDAVRPGLALYRGAARAFTRLVEARDSHGPAGYSGFMTPRHGIILAGYSHGLARGPCLVNGAPRRILEVGMQSSYLELGPGDRVGDEVVLLGDGLTEEAVAREWSTTPHQALVRLATAATMRT